MKAMQLPSTVYDNVLRVSPKHLRRDDLKDWVHISGMLPVLVQ